jgi:hypothetical protein
MKGRRRDGSKRVGRDGGEKEGWKLKIGLRWR